MHEKYGKLLVFYLLGPVPFFSQVELTCVLCRVYLLSIGSIVRTGRVPHGPGLNRTVRFGSVFCTVIGSVWTYRKLNQKRRLKTKPNRYFYGKPFMVVFMVVT
jgi:hypothetical protein